MRMCCPYGGLVVQDVTRGRSGGSGILPVMTARATIRSVSRVQSLRADGATGRQTAIDKRPIAGSVAVTELGLDGDTQIDRRWHGGPSKALYAVSATELDWWSDHLGRPVPDGAFGENLTIEGLDVDAARLGERWLLGDATDPHHVIVEVSEPRNPCGTFARWMGEPGWVARYTERGCPGAYLAVRRPGVLVAGTPVTVLSSDATQPTIRQAFGRGTS